MSKRLRWPLRQHTVTAPHLPISFIISRTVVISFITSRLDDCNSVFGGLPAAEITRLQRIHNNATRLVLRKSKRDHVSPLLQRLHWLSIPARIDDKVATLAYRHLEGSLPPYLSSTLFIYQPSRSLRSSQEKLLKVPRENLKAFGHRSFGYQELASI